MTKPRQILASVPRPKEFVIDNVLSFGSLAIAIIFSVAIWIEACSFPHEVWTAANYRRTLWLIYLFVPVMGVVYLLFVRPKLHKLSRDVAMRPVP